MPLSRRWIRRRCLPPSSLLRRLHHRIVRHCRRGAIGRRHRTIFASPGLLPSPLGIAVPCTHLAIPLCHPAASICLVAVLCAAVVVMRGACALRSWRPFSGAVPGPWACQWGGGEGAAGPLACGVHRHRFVVSRDQCRALVHNAWALQPGGGWLRGWHWLPRIAVAVAPSWVLVVAARTVGLLVTGTTLLCAVPGPLGPVYDGCGGAVGALPLVGVVVVARRCGCWWWQRAWLGIGRLALCSCAQHLGLWARRTVVVGGAGGVLRLLSWSRAIEVVGGWSRVSVGNGAIGIALLRATPGPSTQWTEEGQPMSMTSLKNLWMMMSKNY